MLSPLPATIPHAAEAAARTWPDAPAVISTAAQDQSRALQEVNSTVNQMDQMTQKNAAMVEETTAASRELANEADALMTLVRQFKLSNGGRSRYARAA